MKTIFFKSPQGGFTLVELLIVVTLIGILAVAVLSALNPIEQINKSRDAGRKTDAAQLLQAIERYYINSEQFPWNKVTGSFQDPAVTPFMGTADMIGVGVCGAASAVPTTSGASTIGCAATPLGILVQADEIKPQFGKRNYFKTATGISISDVLYVLKPANTTATSVCYIPASNALRKQWNVVGGPMKHFTVTGGVPAVTTLADVHDCEEDFTAEPSWTVASACYVCLPDTQ